MKVKDAIALLEKLGPNVEVTLIFGDIYPGRGGSPAPARDYYPYPPVRWAPQPYPYDRTITCKDFAH